MEEGTTEYDLSRLLGFMNETCPRFVLPVDATFWVYGMSPVSVVVTLQSGMRVVATSRDFKDSYYAPDVTADRDAC